MRLSPLPVLCVASVLAAAPVPPPKASVEAEAARKTLREVLATVDADWFGQAYQGITSVQVQGNLGIQLSGAAVDRKVGRLSQGQATSRSRGGTVQLRLKGTYFANGDFRTDLTGDFGSLLYARRGDRGFLYSRELNAYTTRVDLPPSDAPLTYMAWFRQTLNEIQAVYLDGSTFRASLAGAGREGSGLARLVFTAPTHPWDAKQREQSLAQSLGFWKRGRLEISVDKATKLPRHLAFQNTEQGVRTQMDFAYGEGQRIASVTLTNRSRGFEGPGWLRVSYAPDGRMSRVAGELSNQDQKISFDMDLAWSKTLTAADIAALPPAGATKRGGDELEAQLLIGLAGQIFGLQRQGLNLRSVAVASR